MSRKKLKKLLDPYTQPEEEIEEYWRQFVENHGDELLEDLWAAAEEYKDRLEVEAEIREVLGDKVNEEED